MEMTTRNELKHVVLDGKSNGICIWIYGNENFILNKDGSIKLFTSLKLARTYLAVVENIKNPYSYHVYIKIGDLKIDIECAGKVMNIPEMSDDKEYYSFYLENGDRYFCSESVTEKVTSIGYYVFENGDSERTAKEIGYKKEKMLKKAIKKCAENVLLYPNQDATIDSETKDRYGNLCFTIKNTTAKIHICFNSQIMDINQERKEDSNRCIPYDKSMDKFSTIFCFATQDMNEPVGFGSKEKTNTVIRYIKELLEDEYPELDPRYIPISFNGVITF